MLVWGRLVLRLMPVLVLVTLAAAPVCGHEPGSANGQGGPELVVGESRLSVSTLRNIDFMPRLHTLQPPARPHKVLRWHHEQVQLRQDQKILRLLLVSVGIAGIFIAILVLRTMPQGKKENSLR